MSEEIKVQVVEPLDTKPWLEEILRAEQGSKSFDPFLEPERERVDATYAKRLKAPLSKLERLRQGDYREAEEICKKVARGE